MRFFFHTHRSVDREGLHHVVNGVMLEELACCQVYAATGACDNCSAIWFDHRAASRDADQACESTIISMLKADCVAARRLILALSDHPHDDCCHRTDPSRNGRRNHSLGRNFCVPGKQEGRHAVESKPTKPEDEHPQRLKYRTIARDFEFVDEVCATRPDQHGPDERRNAACHMNDARTCEVDHAAAKEQIIGAPSGAEALRVPNDTHDDRINDRYQATCVGNLCIIVDREGA